MTTEAMDILLVEDRPEDVALTLRALAPSQLAKRVHVARDGVEALEWLRANEQPKVILLDLKLPRVSGLEVLAQIRADAAMATVPIVVLTSSREMPDIDRAYALGANSYIVKPVDFEQFAKAVSQAGVYWLLINQPPHLRA